MQIEPGEIEEDKCYRTENGQVRLVIALDNDRIAYCARGQRHFLDWHDTVERKSAPRHLFAAEVAEEVPYFWEPPRNGPLA